MLEGAHGDSRASGEGWRCAASSPFRTILRGNERPRGDGVTTTLTPTERYDPRQLTARLRAVVSRPDDRRLVLRCKRDDASNKTMAWLRLYYPGVRTLATAEVAGCNSSCRTCWSSLSHRYPTSEMVDDLVQRGGARFLTGTETADRLARLARGNSNVQQRITGAEPTITPQWLMDFLSRSLAIGRHVALETNGLDLGYDPVLADQLVRLLEPQRHQVRITSHFLAPTKEALLANTLLVADAYSRNLDGIAALERIGGEHHRVLLAWLPGTEDGEARYDAWLAALSEFREELVERSIDPLGLELRPLRPFRGAVSEMRRNGLEVSRGRMASDFLLAVRAWCALVPGYRLPFRWPGVY